MVTSSHDYRHKAKHLQLTAVTRNLMKLNEVKLNQLLVDGYLLQCDSILVICNNSYV